MYFITCHGKPRPEAGDIQGAGGAYINCYILQDSFYYADKIARKNIEEMKWEILVLEEACEVEEDTISEGGRKYFEQALIDKTGFVFHTYPIDEEE